MSQNPPIQKGKSLVAELAQVCREISDEQIWQLFGDGTIEELLNAILDPSDVGKFPTIADYFLANKHRAWLIAAIRDGINKNHSIKGVQDGVTGYVSINNFQWFDNGVMLLEGLEPFAGFMCLYQDGRMSYAVVARDAEKGESLGPDDFEFVDAENMRQRLERQQLSKLSKHELDVPVQRLRQLLDKGESNEGEYQRLFAKYPWVFGFEYKSLQRHENLDDQNIPDFTAVRYSDACRDIFEIKPPSMRLFRKDGEFTANFYAAWNQAERYLTFAREEEDYLRRKGLRFDNPRCLLICGYNLSKEQIRKVRIKEKMNPAIQFKTYNDIIVFMEATIGFVKRFAKLDDQDSSAD